MENNKKSLNKYIVYYEDGQKIVYIINPMSSVLRVLMFVLIIAIYFIISTILQRAVEQSAYSQFADLSWAIIFIFMLLLLFNMKSGFQKHKLVIDRANRLLEYHDLKISLSEITGIYVTEHETPSLEVVLADQQRRFLFRAASPLQRGVFKLIAADLWREVVKYKA